jgi:hypothetical protein
MPQYLRIYTTKHIRRATCDANTVQVFHTSTHIQKAILSIFVAFVSISMCFV